MEEKKTGDVKLITKEQVDHVVETITKAQKDAGEKESKIDFEKAKEIIKSFEGTSIHTVTLALSSAFILLPINSIVTALDMGKSVIKVKTLSALFNVFGGAGCSDCKGCKDCKECTDGECPLSQTNE